MKSLQTTSDPLSRPAIALSVLIPSIAFVLRYLALQSFNTSLYADFLSYDERVYHNWALRILDGRANDYSVHDFGPLPAYFMAMIYGVLGTDIQWMRWANIILGTFSCFLIFLIAKRLYGTTPGLLAGALAAIYSPFIFFSISALKTNLGLCLFSLMVFLMLSARHRWHPLKITGLAAATLLTVNVRPNAILLAPAIAIILLLFLKEKEHRLKAVLIYTCAFLAFSIPNNIRNYQHTGRIGLTAAGGFNLYLANNIHNPLPYYRPVVFASSKPSEQAVQFVIEAVRRSNQKLTVSQASDYWKKTTLQEAWHHPTQFSRRLGLKILALFNQYEPADNFDLGFISQYVAFFRHPFPQIGFILPLGMAGLCLSGPQKENRVIIQILFWSYAITLVIFFTNIRIRAPLLVLLIPSAAFSLVSLYRCAKRRQWRRLLIASGLIFIFAALEFLPIPGADDRSSAYNTHALVLMSKRRHDEAVTIFRKSSALGQSYSAYADLSLARHHYQRQEKEIAHRFVSQISDDSFAAALKYALLGDIAQQEGDVDTALACYRRSLEINSGQRLARRKLTALLQHRAPIEYQNQRKLLKSILEYYGNPH